MPVTPDNGWFDSVLQITQHSEAKIIPHKQSLAPKHPSCLDGVGWPFRRPRFLAVRALAKINGAPVTLTTDSEIHVESQRAHLARQS